MSKNVKKITVKNITKSAMPSLPMMAMLAALGVSSLTYTVTVSADTTTTSSKPLGIHMQRGKKGHDKHQIANGVKPAAAGVIQSIDGMLVTIKDRSDTVYTIDVSGANIFRGGRGQASTTIAASSLKVGDMLGVKGVLTGTHVVATDVMTSAQHPFMKKLHEKLVKTPYKSL
jgi:hypothetical protein